MSEKADDPPDVYGYHYGLYGGSTQDELLYLTAQKECNVFRCRGVRNTNNGAF